MLNALFTMVSLPYVLKLYTFTGWTSPILGKDNADSEVITKQLAAVV